MPLIHASEPNLWVFPLYSSVLQLGMHYFKVCSNKLIIKFRILISIIKLGLKYGANHCEPVNGAKTLNKCVHQKKVLKDLSEYLTLHETFALCFFLGLSHRHETKLRSKAIFVNFEVFDVTSLAFSSLKWAPTLRRLYRILYNNSNSIIINIICLYIKYNKHNLFILNYPL